MHYYQFNIADYRKDTAHLSPMEHYVYRQLIDWYYLDEKPIPKKTQVVIRRLGLGSDGLSVLDNVLQDFFRESKNGWVHKRIEEEIASYREKADKARLNGRKGGRPKKQKLTETEKPRKTQPVILANQEETGSKANHKPITNNQEPINNTLMYPSKLSQKKKKPKHTFTSEDMELATFIWLHVDGLAPGQKPPNLESWANDVRLMREIDKRSHENIKEVFFFAHNDQFWRSNIRSPAKLRKQFDTLNTKRINEHEKNQRFGGNGSGRYQGRYDIDLNDTDWDIARN